MLLRIFVLCLAAVSFVCAEEFSLSPLESGGMNQKRYYDTLGIPDIYVGRKCYEKCKQDCCYATLENEKGEVLRSFSTSDSVVQIAHGRYKERAYLYYAVTTSNGKNAKTTHRLIDNRLNAYDTPQGTSSAFASLISPQGELVQIASEGLFINGSHLLERMDFEQGALGANIEGDIAAAGIDRMSDAVVVSNLQQWKTSTMRLAKRSDRNDILALYPFDASNLFLAAYNRINVYNKGLMGATINFDTDEVKQGWIYNSEKNNVGFYPELYKKDASLLLKTHNSTQNSSVYFLLAPQELAMLGAKTPQREGFEDESLLDFMAGAGVAYMAWDVKSKVEKDEKKYADTKYDISDTLYKELYLQGRVGDTQLAISYAQNEAQKQGGLTQKATKLLNVFVDFHSLVSDSSALRLGYTKAQVSGVSTFNDYGYGGVSLTPNGEQKEFTTTLERISLLLMLEKGLYFGGEYTTFTTPSTVGFSGSSKTIEYYALDNSMGIKNYEVVFGYDTAAYAKRYEADYSSFYFQGLFGLGISVYELSAELKHNVESVSAKRIKSSTYSLVLDAELEAGYLWQERFKSVRGLGYSVELGIKARGIYSGIGQSDESKNDLNANELQLEMQRYDLWYGPYCTLNLVF